MPEALSLALPFFAAAILYSSVGHGGASAYLAIMALAGVAPVEMRPIALVLNVIVAGIAFSRFARAGEFSPRIFALLAILSVPAAYAGGRVAMPGEAYEILLGAILLIAAWNMLERSGDAAGEGRASPLQLSVSGGAIGFLSGLTGIGGGVFLTPWLIYRRWAVPRMAAGISAAFIVVNSLAGLAGQWILLGGVPPSIGWYAIAVAGGGALGSGLAVKRFDSRALRRVLALVLLIAGLKMLLAPLMESGRIPARERPGPGIVG